MTIRLAYAIHFVADMNRAVAFYRDTIGLPLKFSSPEWSEFATGSTTLALHPASAENPAGTTHLGLHADDIASAHRQLTSSGARFTRDPAPQHGITLAEFVDPEGARVSLSG
ncbi:MAG TPA: VOC family protein [Casimicrobiaceae bacterium]|nr:VOC family protein [Casimicrobiaceae bacterium]